MEDKKDFPKKLYREAIEKVATASIYREQNLISATTNLIIWFRVREQNGPKMLDLPFPNSNLWGKLANFYHKSLIPENN